jgi:hypothetical protein
MKVDQKKNENLLVHLTKSGCLLKHHHCEQQEDEIKKMIVQGINDEEFTSFLVFCDSYTLPSLNCIHKRMFRAAKKSLLVDNAGGGSQLSEALSIHYFSERFHARRFVFENDIEYWIQYKMADFLCSIEGRRVGVSVTRAMGFPSPENFTEEDANRLMYSKMHGLVIARSGVSERHEFSVSILHCWCQTERIASLVKKAYEKVVMEDESNTLYQVIVLLSICPDDFIYRNQVKPQ